VNLHRLLADWGEGASFATGGSGAAAQPDDATWLHTFYPAASWKSPGGDFAPALSAARMVGSDGDWAWSSAELTADVRAWIAAPSTRFGWILLGDESTSGTARRFDSRESTTAAWRPRLILFYSLPTPARSITWGRLQRAYR
jgi:hypothetical protein